ncbi:phage tail assembly chaperone [bacterium AH-315-P15]|nr:phage tail assembly chaperone [bacterium AH-315-P15]
MPWAELLGLAVARFGLTPHAFWRLSLAEWNMLMAGRSECGATSPITRAEFEELAHEFPDTQST